MKKNKVQLKVLCTVFSLCTAMTTVASAADGGLFVEPAITYQKTDTRTNWPVFTSDSTGSIEGFGLGARLGFHLNEAFFLGFDARYSMPQFKDSSVTYDAKATEINWGPVVGMQMPDMGLRIWAGYIMGGEIDPERSGSFDTKLKEATGYRAGVGFRVSSVSLNLEYQQYKYGKVDASAGSSFFTGSTSFTNVNPEAKGFIASVSFPLEL